MKNKIFLIVLIGILCLGLTGCSNDDKQRDKIYDNIINELSKNNLISNDWKYVASDYSPDLLGDDRSNKYYFYIDKTLYDTYKYYWLEDVDKSVYYDGYNSELDENGDHILKSVHIQELEYEEDCDNCYLTKIITSENLDKDKSYYSVSIYDKAIYAKWVIKYENKKDYTIYDWFKVDRDSLTKRYIFYQENGKWIFKLLEN